jgi:ribosomal protein S18 acetylase RimI-like enzyme
VVTLAAQVEVERAQPSEAEQLGWLIAESFVTGDRGAGMPATEWLVPDPDDRCRVLAHQFTMLVEHATRWGQVETTAARDAVAVWMPVGGGPQPPAPRDYERRLHRECAPYTERLLHLDALFAAHHPREPHHYLMFLAVHPDRQGHGIGGCLLAHHLDQLDQHPGAAYLEASGRRNRALYRRHGFALHGDPFDLGSRALFWPMWRPPAGAG